MQTTESPSPQSRNYLATLDRMLDLAQQTAEAASAEGNHKVVIQAIREVTRIVTLMQKIMATSDQKMASQLQTPIQGQGLDKQCNLKPPQPKGAGKKILSSPDQETNDSKLPTGHGNLPLQGNWLEELAAGRLNFDTLHAIGSGRWPRPAGEIESTGNTSADL